MAKVTLEGVSKRYPGGVVAVRDANLEVRDREFMILVGPSGCGKSTLLRMVAGLEEISEGRVLIDDRVVNDIPPKNRDIAMVFQNYALYPHMTVYDNMAFGLRMRKFNKTDIRERVEEAAAILGIESLLERKPKALSGGQRQRVAVGRAIVRKPKVFLFDEPLSNLDAKLRVQMRAELSALHHRLEATMIYVTHDQTEAMTMGDRITVLKDGLIQQINDPVEIYEHPENMFVAGFIGSPAINFLHGIVENDTPLKLKGDDFELPIPEALAHRSALSPGQEVVIGIRPEHFSIPRGSNGVVREIELDVVEPMGHETYLHFTIGKTKLTARVAESGPFTVGSTIRLSFDLSKAHLFDQNTGVVLRG
jgi:multiple sugar transport system ATP-binding protein